MQASVNSAKTFSSRPFFQRAMRYSPCLYCGVDSGPVVGFFLWFVGAGVLASFCWLLWGLGSGKLRDDEKIASIPLEIEKGDGLHG